MLTLGRAPLVPGDGHNITQNTRWPVHAAQKAFLTFTHLSAFYAFAKKTKIFLRQTLAEHIPWELITPGDVRNSSSLNNHSALVGNSFWDYVITGIVFGTRCHWYNACDIPGHIWILWNALTLPPPPPLSLLSPLSAQCRLCSCPSVLSLPAAIALFTFYHFFLAVFCRRRQFFQCPSLRFVQLLTPAPLCLLSQPRSDPWLAPGSVSVSLF